MPSNAHVAFQSPLEKQLFGRTFEHPILGPFVEWVPLAWLLSLSNPSPSDTTDLGTWSAPETVDMHMLYASLEAKGMRDPFIVGVGRVSRTIRLEAGNHRVRVLMVNGLHRAPAVAYVGDSAITSLGNGSHEGVQAELLIPPPVDIMGPYPIKEFLRLSQVLRTMPSADFRP